MNDLWPKQVFSPPERQTKLFIHEIDPYLDFCAVRVVLDVGSRDGCTAREFREWFPAASVHAFECDPVGLMVCRRNLKDSGVELVESAACDHDGKINFNHVVGNPGTSSLLLPAIDFAARGIARTNAITQVEVPCLRLDTWLGDRIAEVIWVDVQGAELSVLKGLGTKLSLASAVFVEAATKEVYRGQALKDAVIKFMQDAGFRLLLEKRYWDMESYYIFVNSRLRHSGFPSYREWLDSVCHPQDLCCRSEDFYRCAREKRDLAGRFQPKKIVEIGVRLGYSAHAFLCGSSGASYLGYDIVGGGHGGTKVAGMEYPEKILKRDFPKSEVRLVTMDTQAASELGISDVDFFHVDGDHSMPGAMHDMGMAWKTLRSGGVMVVDDYDWLPQVRKAIDVFTEGHRAEMASHEYLKTFRGDVVMVKK